MPKPKPDQIVRHEIALSRPLQETIDGYVASAQFRNVADPMVQLVNDDETLALMLGAMALLGITGVSFAFIVGGGTALDIFNDFVAQRASALSRKLGADEKLGAVSDRIKNPTASNPLEVFFAQLFNVVN